MRIAGSYIHRLSACHLQHLGVFNYSGVKASVCRGCCNGLPVPGSKLNVYQHASIVADQHPDWFQEDVTTLFDLLKGKQLQPAVWRRMPLEQAAQAHKLIEERQVRGKIVLQLAR